MIYKEQVIPMGYNTIPPNVRPKINILFDWAIHRMGRRLKRETTLSVQLLALKQKMNQLQKNTFPTKIASCIQFCLNISKEQITFLSKD